MEPVIFNARILRNEGRSGGSYVEFPFNAEEVFGIKGRVPVICYFDGIEYRGSLVKMGGPCHIIGILKDIQAKLGKKPGDMVEVKVIKDETERTIEPDSSLMPYLDAIQEIKSNYNKLSFTKKKEINQFLESAKKEETKQNRLNGILKDLGL